MLARSARICKYLRQSLAEPGGFPYRAKREIKSAQKDPDARAGAAAAKALAAI